MNRPEYRPIPRRKIYLITFIFLCLILVFWYLLPLFLFPIQDIHLLGNFRIPKDQVMSNLDYLKGFPLFRVSRLRISSLLESGWVKEVKIYRLPPHTLLVKIIERTPFLIIAQENGNTLLVDEEGYVIESPSQMIGLPTLLIDSIRLDENNKVPEPFFKTLKEIFEELEESPIKIDKLSISPTGELSAYTRGNMKIIFGEEKDIFQKLFVLKKLYERIPHIEERLVYINLSCPSKPAIMEKKSK